MNSSNGFRRELFNQIHQALIDDPFWSVYFYEHLKTPESDFALHVAIFQEPFLTWVLEGKKRVESRFSQNQVAPFGAIAEGDAVLIKRVSGPLVGICHVNAAWSYRLDPATWSFIRTRFSELLCAEGEDFWNDRKDARFATLISIDHVSPLPDISYPKTDRRGWVIEQDRLSQYSLNI